MIRNSHNGKRLTFLVFILSAALLLAITLGVSMGSASLKFSHVWGIIFGHDSSSYPANEISIVWRLRLPRVLLGAITGAGLAIAGTVIQTLVNNSLADPYLLGISSGACTGAVFGILTGHINAFLMAFVGALLAFAFVFVVAGYRTGRLTPIRMILAGLAVSCIFNAITNFMIYMTRHNGAENAMFWLMGSLGGARWGRIELPFAIVLASLIVFVIYARYLDSMLLGEEHATALGVNVKNFRIFLFVMTSILTAAITSVSGSIGFVGLIVPHAVRIITGSKHRILLPVSALAGAVFLILTDLFARTVLAPRELPLGIITGFTGAPFFVWLLCRKK